MEKDEEVQKTDAPLLSKKKHAKKALHLSRSSLVPSSDPPVNANFDSSHLTIGAGVAIFHLASSRVILCQHSVKKYWFLPKGRRDAGEDTVRGAEREGFEESGYRNRLLPIPISHRQPFPHGSSGLSPFVCEPVWTQLVPLSRSSQYMLFWYIAETVPPDVESSLESPTSTPSAAYQQPPRYPADMTLAQRIALEPENYAPVRHENTAADTDEAFYVSHLLSIETALQKLEGTVSADVVRKGWTAICLRREMEDKNDSLVTRTQ